jgi:hypothetical protein
MLNLTFHMPYTLTAVIESYNVVAQQNKGWTTVNAAA